MSAANVERSPKKQGSAEERSDEARPYTRSQARPEGPKDLPKAWPEGHGEAEMPPCHGPKGPNPQRRMRVAAGF